MRRCLAVRRWLLVIPWAFCLMGAGPCDDSSAPTASDGGAGTGGPIDGPKAQGDGGPEGGSCLDKYEPLSTAAQRLLGTWLIDDAGNNRVCPNGWIVEIIGYGEQGVPFADPEAGPCSPPSQLLLIKPYDIKDCSDIAICGTQGAGQVFYVHAGPKEYRGGGYNEAIWVVNGTDTHRLDGQDVLLDPTQPDKLNLANKPYTRVAAMTGGRCKPPVQ